MHETSAAARAGAKRTSADEADERRQDDETAGRDSWRTGWRALCEEHAPRCRATRDVSFEDHLTGRVEIGEPKVVERPTSSARCNVAYDRDEVDLPGDRNEEPHAPVVDYRLEKDVAA